MSPWMLRLVRNNVRFGAHTGAVFGRALVEELLEHISELEAERDAYAKRLDEERNGEHARRWKECALAFEKERDEARAAFDLLMISVARAMAAFIDIGGCVVPDEPEQLEDAVRALGAK